MIACLSLLLMIVAFTTAYLAREARARIERLERDVVELEQRITDVQVALGRLIIGCAQYGIHPAHGYDACPDEDHLPKPEGRP